LRTGIVAEFDDHRGVGSVRDDDGIEHFFHGTRTIEVGARVVFEIVPGHGGRWEAAAITVASPAAGLAPRRGRRP
jgi:cold shock CspA family protein